MRRTLFFALMLCLQWTAWGQATYDYRYWFDADESNQRTGSMTAGSGHIDADLSGLDNSLHTIHIQVKDTAGVWSAPITRHFIKIPEKSALSPYYWFNNDYAGRKSLPALSGVFDIDVSGLSGALNTFHYQVSDIEGSASAPLTSYFLKVPATKSMTYRYWLDNDTSTMKRGEYTGETLMLDVSKIQDGIHVLHLQMEATGGASTPFTALFMKVPDMKNMTYRYWVDNDHTTMKSGRYVGEPLMVDVSDMEDGFHIIYFQVEGTGGASIPANRMFIKIPQTEDIGEMTCVCTIDGKLYKQEKVASSGGTVNWEFDVSKFSQGLHRIQVQVLTPSGAASNVHDGFFFRSIMQEDLQSMTLVYSIDGEAYQSQVGDFNTGMFHFDVDVASLNDGLHRLTYMLSSETGSTTKASTSFFVKTPLGGPGIASYKYWLNDYEDEARFVKLAERKNPYELISLLPVDECPIRSTCFHFEVEEDGTPMVYAKNDIHLQFFDVSNRVAEAHKQYVDYNVGEAIEEITLLESGKRVYKAKPQDNKIHWFKVEAERGDSLIFKTDLAASIDVFNAKGDILYHAEGSDVVKFDGCRVDETNTYYVALHDATAKNGSTVALDYIKIDKYAVLSYSPNEVGILSETVVDFFFNGNGYDKLTEVYMQCGTEILVPDTMFIFGKADMLLKYKITNDFVTGDYDAILKFEDNGEKDSLIINDAISFVKGVWKEPEVTVSSERILAKPYPVKISVKNNSNVSMMYIPLNIAWDNPGKFNSVDFSNFIIPVDSAVYSDGYEPLVVTNNFLGKGISAAVLNMFIPLLSPGETIDLTLEFNWPNHTRFNVYAWTGKAFNHPLPSYDSLTNIPSVIDYYVEMMNANSVVRPLQQTRSTSIEQIAINTARERAEDRLTERALRHVNGNLRRAGGAATTVGNNAVTTGHLFAGIINGAAHTVDMEYLRAYGIDPSDPLYEEISNLHRMEAPTDIFDSGWQGFAAWLWERQQRCTQNSEPEPNPTPIEILNPVDPNDILGYTSESGSKYIKKDFTDVGYTIRFENDPALATAAAHTIVITDTIDGTVHNLKTFKPTSIKIGDIITELDGKKEFIQTIDLRPRINVIAQVTLKQSSSTGIAQWTIESLDPMTMEPTEDAMDGVLPINSNGEGEGELAYDIQLKPGLIHGTEIRNKATIIFDMENAITTPEWVNIVDAIAPKSSVIETVMKNDTTMTVFFDGTDNYSGVWKYDLYVQAGVGTSWFKLAENLTDSLYDYRVYEGIDYGFCVIATDSAGNVEQKELIREGIVLDYLPGDVNDDGRVSVVDLTMVTNAILRKEDEGFNAKAADLNMDGQISITDATMITNLILKK